MYTYHIIIIIGFEMDTHTRKSNYSRWTDTYATH